MEHKKTIREIKEQLQQIEFSNQKGFVEFLQFYESDSRSGVITICEEGKKKIIQYEEEVKRIEGMKQYEYEYESKGYVCGVDEVGRGPLAGPVVAGAVILPKNCNILYLNDSKKLSEKKREELYETIMEEAIATGIGIVSAERIDEINILQATYEAMRQALDNLCITPDILLNDAVTIPQVTIPQIPIIKGDAKSISIAAASIIAKVTRDRMMVMYDDVMPEYGFAAHKGYGSQTHIQVLETIGLSKIHRKSFCKNFCSK
ncbi:MAG: ribonuclease HII [Eubacteriales bacterium]